MKAGSAKKPQFLIQSIYKSDDMNLRKRNFEELFIRIIKNSELNKE